MAATLDGSRMFVTADGESGKTAGNRTIRVDEHGRLRIKVPAGLVDRTVRTCTSPPGQRSHTGAIEWAARVAGRRAVRYDISVDPQRGRWYLDTSWTTTPPPAVDLELLRAGPVLGVDLNADHLAACVLDSSGNPIGGPVTIPMELPACGPATVTAGFGRRSPRCSTSPSGTNAPRSWSRILISPMPALPAAKRWAAASAVNGYGAPSLAYPPDDSVNRLTAMASRCGIGVIGVDPAYTSTWGRQYWAKPLQQQTSDPSCHRASRRGGRDRQTGTRHADQASTTGPRTQQRMRAGTPPGRPVRPPNTTRRASPGSPTRPQRRRGAPVHQKTPTASGQHRSGRTGLTPAHY